MTIIIVIFIIIIYSIINIDYILFCTQYFKLIYIAELLGTLEI